MLLDIIDILDGKLESQSILVVLLLIAIFFLVKANTKVSKDKEDLSIKVIKLATLWEEKTSKDNDVSNLNYEINKDIVRSLDDIKKDITRIEELLKK